MRRLYEKTAEEDLVKVKSGLDKLNKTLKGVSDKHADVMGAFKKGGGAAAAERAKKYVSTMKSPRAVGAETGWGGKSHSSIETHKDTGKMVGKAVGKGVTHAIHHVAENPKAYLAGAAGLAAGAMLARRKKRKYEEGSGMTRAGALIEKHAELVEDAKEYFKQASAGASKLVENPHAAKAAAAAGIAAAGYAAGKAVGKARHKYGSVRSALAAPGRRRKAAELRARAERAHQTASELEAKATPRRGKDEEDNEDED